MFEEVFSRATILDYFHRENARPVDSFLDCVCELATTIRNRPQDGCWADEFGVRDHYEFSCRRDH
jgi:hypothetical protein